MDIKRKIILLEQEIDSLRLQWKDASPAFKIDVERKAKNLKSQIHVFESVLRRRGELPPTEEELKKIFVDEEDLPTTQTTLL